MIEVFLKASKHIKSGGELTIMSSISGSHKLIHYAEIGSTRIILINQRFEEYTISSLGELVLLFEHKLVFGMNHRITKESFRMDITKADYHEVLKLLEDK